MSSIVTREEEKKKLVCEMDHGAEISEKEWSENTGWFKTGRSRLRIPPVKGSYNACWCPEHHSAYLGWVNPKESEVTQIRARLLTADAK